MIVVISAAGCVAEGLMALSDIGCPASVADILANKLIAARSVPNCK